MKKGRRVRRIAMGGIDRHNVYYKEEIKFHVPEISQEVLVHSSGKSSLQSV